MEHEDPENNFINALDGIGRHCVAVLVFGALMAITTYLIKLAGGTALKITGISLTGRAIGHVAAIIAFNGLAGAIGFFCSLRGTRRLLYQKLTLRQRLLFLRKETTYFIYLILMIGLVLPYLMTWTSLLWGLLKEHLRNALLVL